MAADAVAADTVAADTVADYYGPAASLAASTAGPEARTEPEASARTEPEASARTEPEASAGVTGTTAVADEDPARTMWSTITWDEATSTHDADAGTHGTSAGTGEADTRTAGADDVLDPGQPVAAEPSEPAEPALQPVAAEPSEPAEGNESSEGKASSGVEQVTVVPGVPRYHEPDCILIRFMDEESVQRTTVPDAEKAGCTPCRACQPE